MLIHTKFTKIYTTKMWLTWQSPQQHVEMGSVDESSPSQAAGTVQRWRYRRRNRRGTPWTPGGTVNINIISINIIASSSQKKTINFDPPTSLGWVNFVIKWDFNFNRVLKLTFATISILGYSQILFGWLENILCQVISLEYTPNL